MNRRKFLTLFGVSAAVLLLPGEMSDSDYDDEVIDEPPYEWTPVPYNGPRRITMLYGQGIADTQSKALFGIKRKGSGYDLMRFALNAYGGMIHWRALPGQEIIIPNGEEIELWAYPGVKAYAPIQLPGISKYMVLES